MNLSTMIWINRTDSWRFTLKDRILSYNLIMKLCFENAKIVDKDIYENVLKQSKKLILL